MTEKSIRSFVGLLGLSRDESERLITTILGDLAFWEGSEREFSIHVTDWKDWWPARKDEEEKLAAYETGEIYGIAGLYSPSEYGASDDGGPFGGIF